MSSRENLEAALAAMADRLSPGSGEQAVRHFKNDIQMIVSSSDATIRRYAAGEITVALPVIFESKHPDGDPVVFEKARDGVIVVYPDALVFVRGIAFGARESKAFGLGDLSVEKVTCALNGAEVPGLRISARSGKPTFAVAIGQAEAPGNPADLAAVRDELYGLLAK